MERRSAINIGQVLAIKSAVVGILIAYAIFGYLLYTWNSGVFESVFWIFDVEYWYHLLIGAVGLLIMAYLFGRYAAIEILIKKKNEMLVGVKYGLIILITGTLIGSSVGFLQEGLDDIGGFSNPFYDYYIKPLYWITIFGALPVLIMGIWFGRRIKSEGTKFS